MEFFKFLLRAVVVCLVLALASEVLPGFGDDVSAFFLKCAVAAALVCLLALLRAGLGEFKDALGFFGFWPR